MVSAFLNTVKIPELRRRILFTLAVIVIVRLGAAITTPGVNQAVLHEWFRSSLTEKAGGGVAALFNLFSGLAGDQKKGRNNARRSSVIVNLADQKKERNC